VNPGRGILVQLPMRLLALIALATPLLARPAPEFSVVDDWGIHGNDLRIGCLGWPIRVDEVAKRLEMKEDAARAYLDGLDTALPLLVEQEAGKAVVGVWQVTADLLAKDLRLELELPKTTKAGERFDFAVKLVNGGKAAHRVVRPNDGSESGWREPLVRFEMEVGGRWVPAGNPPRCGNYASNWHRDVMVLGAGDSLKLDGYLPPYFSFDLKKPGKVKLRAVYEYAGGRSKAGKKPDPGPMGKTPPFRLVSKAVEVELK